MTYDELDGSQKLELKQRILTERNEQKGEGTSYGELAEADTLVSDEDAKAWAAGMEFSPDDFCCSAGKTFRVRVRWPVSKVYQVQAQSLAEALAAVRAKIDAGEVCVWTDGFTADESGETVEPAGTETLSGATELKGKKLEDVTMQDLERCGVVPAPSYFDFRLGWNPPEIGDVPALLRLLGRVAHWDWQMAMGRGDVPCEDVSPQEGFYDLAEELEARLKEKPCDTGSC